MLRLIGALLIASGLFLAASRFIIGESAAEPYWFVIAALVLLAGSALFLLLARPDDVLKRAAVPASGFGIAILLLALLPDIVQAGEPMRVAIGVGVVLFGIAFFLLDPPRPMR